jgi:hypothetical protein
VESTDKQYFELLKTEIVRVMQQTNAGISSHIEDWKGQDITEFQDDLRQKVNTYFSEKWFYNHFKSFHTNLPRIDSLNILSKYAGYMDWLEFKHKNRDKLVEVIEQKGSNRIFYLLPAIAVIVFVLIMTVIKTASITTYRFCFIDRDSKRPLTNSNLQVTLLPDNESPVRLQCDSGGCFTWRTGQQRIRFAVEAPYYFSDTIIRALSKARKTEEIQLKVNDYALMIHYFSNSKVDDWQRRRDQLDNIIADSAYICEVFNMGTVGMALYDKREFINKLTMPVRSLKNIRILNTEYLHDKIVVLRFTQERSENDE